MKEIIIDQTPADGDWIKADRIKDAATIQCSRCGAVSEKIGAKDRLRRFKDRRIIRTFHCPNCDARVLLGKDEDLLLKRLERLKEQAKKLGDQQEVKELQEEIDQLNRGIEMSAGKTKDSLFKGQKVTAIKSEQGLREGETYTVLGEEEIYNQIVGEENSCVYKLQDSSGNVIVVESPKGLFYEVKDASLPTFFFEGNPEDWKREVSRYHPTSNPNPQR